MAGLFSFAQALAGGPPVFASQAEEDAYYDEQARLQEQARNGAPAEGGDIIAAGAKLPPVTSVGTPPIVAPRWADVAGPGPAIDANAPALLDRRAMIFQAQEAQRQAAAQAMGQEYAPREQKNAQFKAHPRLQFGTTGVARDIIGNLTDFVGSLIGRTPTYAREKWQDAIYGWDQPGQFEAAMSRGMQYDPERTATFMEQISQQQHRVGTRENQAEATESSNKAREELSADRKFTNINQAQTQLQRLLAGAKTPAQRKAFAEIYGPLLAQRAGVTEAELGLTPTMTDDDLQAFAAGDMTVVQSKTLPMRERTTKATEDRVGIAQQNADTARISATRPRAGGNPPRPASEGEVRAGIMQKIANGVQLTPGEQQLYNDSLPRRAGRRGTGTAAPAAPKRLRFNPATGKIE